MKMPREIKVGPEWYGINRTEPEKYHHDSAVQPLIEALERAVFNFELLGEEDYRGLILQSKEALAAFEQPSQPDAGEQEKEK